MAAPQCMSNDGNQAVFVGTFMTDGSAVALCEGCLPQFMISVLAQSNGIDPQVLYNTVDELAGAEDSPEPGDPAQVAVPPDMVDPTSAGADEPVADLGTLDAAPEGVPGSVTEAPPPADSEGQAAGE